MRLVDAGSGRNESIAPLPTFLQCELPGPRHFQPGVFVPALQWLDDPPPTTLGSVWMNLAVGAESRSGRCDRFQLELQRFRE